MNHSFAQVITALESLKEDPMAIKRVKEKADHFIVLIQQGSQLDLDKALHGLEELSSSEIPSYDRTQLWDVISLLESLISSTRP